MPAPPWPEERSFRFVQLLSELRREFDAVLEKAEQLEAAGQDSEPRFVVTSLGSGMPSQDVAAAAVGAVDAGYTSMETVTSQLSGRPVLPAILQADKDERIGVEASGWRQPRLTKFAQDQQSVATSFQEQVEYVEAKQKASVHWAPPCMLGTHNDTSSIPRGPSLTHQSSGLSAASAWTAGSNVAPGRQFGSISSAVSSDSVAKGLAKAASIEERQARTFIELVTASPREAGRRIVHGFVFETLSGLFVMVSIFFIGVDTDYSASYLGSVHDHYNTIHHACNTFFLCELCLRIWVDGTSFFCNPEQRAWNWLDIILVGTSVMDLLLAAGASGSGLAASAGRQIRSIRLLRLLRTIRLFRSLRAIHEFRKMLYAIFFSLRTLVCSLVMLLFIIYFFAVLMCSGVTDYRVQAQGDGEDLHEDLENMYGSLANCLYTLFLAVTNGLSWGLVVVPLQNMQSFYTAAMIFYMALMFFGVANVVTSVFVESAIMTAQHYRDLIVDEKAHAKTVALCHMREVFKEMDTDGSGELSIDEVEYVMTSPNLKCYLEALDLKTNDTRLFFRMIDHDGDGVIGIEEFVDGCLRLQGEAQAIDVHALLHDITIFLARFAQFAQFVEMRFCDLGELAGADRAHWATTSMAGNIKREHFSVGGQQAQKLIERTRCATKEFESSRSEGSD